jgi:hypothetical protein
MKNLFCFAMLSNNFVCYHRFCSIINNYFFNFFLVVGCNSESFRLVFLLFIAFKLNICKSSNDFWNFRFSNLGTSSEICFIQIHLEECSKNPQYCFWILQWICTSKFCFKFTNKQKSYCNFYLLSRTSKKYLYHPRKKKELWIFSN